MTCKKCGGTIHENGCRLCEMFKSRDEAASVRTQQTKTWPMESEALAVHPDQAQEANDRARRHGISVEYDSRGICRIPDQGNYAKILRLEGFHNRSEGYHGS